MAAKNKIAATLLNHWYCLLRGDELGIVKSRPNIKAYQEKLDGFDKLDDKAAKAVDQHFSKQNRKLVMGIFTHLLKQAGATDAKVEAKLRGKTISICIPVKDFKFEELRKYTDRIKSPNQLPVISEIVENLMFGLGDDQSVVITHEFKCAQSDFYENLFNVEKTTQAIITNSMRFLAICRFIREKLSADALRDFKDGQISVDFESIVFDNCTIASSTFKTSETEEARASRVLIESLKKALRARIKKVKDLAETAGSVKYDFDNTEAHPLTFQLEVLTDW